MITNDSMLSTAERSRADATVGSHAYFRKKEYLELRREDILLEPNRVDNDQTQTYCLNGTSNTLEFRLESLLLSSPALPEVREFFLAIQKWEGYVVEVDRDTFRARLAPIVGEGSDQEAEIYMEEVAPADRGLIEPGAVFYWSIGYFDRPSGRLRASMLRFRRLPVWTKHDLELADAEAHRLKGLFDGD